MSTDVKGKNSTMESLLLRALGLGSLGVDTDLSRAQQQCRRASPHCPFHPIKGLLIG